MKESVTARLFKYGFLAYVFLVAVSGLFLNSTNLEAKTITQSNVNADSVDASHNITAVVVKNFPPYYSMDKSGKPTGFAIDTIEEIVRSAGLNITFIVKDTWEETFNTLKSGKADLIPNLGISDKRKKHFEFSKQIQVSDISIIIRSETNNIRSVNDLRNKVIGVVKLNAGGTFVKYLSGISYINYPLAENALFGLLSGNVDAVIFPSSVMLRIARKSGIDDRIKIVGKPLQEIQRAIAVRKGNGELLTKLNIAIEKFKASLEYKNIYIKWYGKPKSFWTNIKIIVSSIIAVVFLIIASGIWRYYSVLNINKRLVLNIKQRKQAEDKIQEKTNELILSNKELNYQKYALDQHSIFLVTDIAGRITYANQKFVDISGYSKEELIGRTNRIVNSGFHPKEFFVHLWSTISAGKVWQGEICNRTKNGEIYWVDTTIIPHLDENGKPDRYIAIRTDITERNLLQKKAQDERKLLEVINSVQSKFIHGIDASSSFETLLQTLLSISQSEYGFISEVLYNSEQQPYLRSMAITNVSWDAETRALYDEQAANGMIFTNLNSLFGEVLTTAEPVISNEPYTDSRRSGLPTGHPELNAFLGVPLLVGSKLIGVIGIANRPDGYNIDLLAHLQPLFTTCARIIDAYKADQQRLSIKAELLQFKSTLDKTEDSVYIYDATSLKFLYANQGALKQVGYSFDELKEMTITEIAPEFSDNNLKELLASLKKSSEHKTLIESVHQHKDGHQIPVEIFVQYIDSTEASPRFVAIVRDTSERKQMQKQLQQAQKMQAIGQLTGGIAHDFNNILASIIGFTHLALQRFVGEEQSELREYLTEVSIAGERGRDLVTQMLAFSRTNTNKAIAVQVAPMVKEVIKLLQGSFPSSVDIESHIDSNIPSVMIEPVHLHQILMNLFINARDAMCDKGHIDIRIQKIQIESSPIGKPNSRHVCNACHSLVEPGEYVEISIQDYGSGINKENINRLFEPFFTTKDVGKGSGMGLSMVHGIVHQNGGHIFVDSQLGKGTTIRLILPGVDTILNDEKDTLLPEDELNDSLLNKHILVVDDEESIARFIADVIVTYGGEATVMTDSPAALDLYRQDSNAFDLVITDQTMPELSGSELAQEILKLRSEQPIILCTGYSEHVDAQIAKDLGIRGYITKPMNVSVLLSTIESLTA